MNKLYAPVGRMIVKDSTENDVSKGGILIANMETGMRSGTVIDIFKSDKQHEDEDIALSNFADDYDMEHPTVEINSTIFYNDNSGYKITYQGEEYRVLSYSDVLAIEFDDEELHRFDEELTEVDD